MQIRHTIGSAFLDQRTLQRERFGVRDDTQPANLTRHGSTTPVAGVLHAQILSTSKFSRCFLTSDMNWSATAPSTSRWS